MDSYMNSHEYNSYQVEDSFIAPEKDKYTKKERGRLRSKFSRDRKKAYIAGLEQKVKSLESEVFRLQNLLISYRNDKLEVIGQEPVSFVQKQISDKINMVKRLFKEESEMENKEKMENKGKSENKEKKEISIYDAFMEDTFNCFDHHKEFLENSFRLVIDHCYPGHAMKFWKDLTGKPIKEYDLIAKHSKLSKYQIPEFEEENGFTDLDRLIVSLKPSKTQYKFLEKVMKKEFCLKKRYKEGIQLLLQAKKIFEETNSDHLLYVKFLLSSKALSDEQILKSQISESYKSKNNSFDEIWNIQVRKKGFVSNIEECPLFGRQAKRTMKKDDRVFETYYNYYSL